MSVTKAELELIRKLREEFSRFCRELGGKPRTCKYRDTLIMECSDISEELTSSGGFGIYYDREKHKWRVLIWGRYLEEPRLEFNDLNGVALYIDYYKTPTFKLDSTSLEFEDDRVERFSKELIGGLPKILTLRYNLRTKTLKISTL